MSTEEEKEASRAQRELVATAKSTTSDLFAILELASPYSANPQPTPTDDQIKKAFRKAALKYHPDKNRGKEEWAAQKYDEATRARDILFNPEARAAYEGKLSSELEKRKKHEALDGHRRRMVEELQKREADAARSNGSPVVGVKRPSAELSERDAKIRKIEEEGRRRRMQIDEDRKRKWEEAKRKDAEEEEDADLKKGYAPQAQGEVDDIDRSVKVRWAKGTLKGDSVSADMLKTLFSKFGAVETVVMLKDKKARPSLSAPSSPLTPADKKPKKQEMGNALVMFKSIVGAHWAVLDSERLPTQGAEWSWLDSISWASGKEPDLGFVRPDKPTGNMDPFVEPTTAASTTSQSRPATPANSGPHLSNGSAPPKFSFTPKGTPAFSSFKQAGNTSSPSLWDSTRMRLREAERKRAEEAIRKQEEAEDEQTRRREAEGTAG